jgi:hypothetical protein
MTEKYLILQSLTFIYSARESNSLGSQRDTVSNKTVNNFREASRKFAGMAIKIMSTTIIHLLLKNITTIYHLTLA